MDVWIIYIYIYIHILSYTYIYIWLILSAGDINRPLGHCPLMLTPRPPSPPQKDADSSRRRDGCGKPERSGIRVVTLPWNTWIIWIWP